MMGEREVLVDGLTKAEWIAREHAYRDSLDDGDFWNYVLLGISPGEEPEPPYYDPEDFLAIGAVGSPCPECGQETECGYDAEGRAYIHVTEENDDA